MTSLLTLSIFKNPKTGYLYSLKNVSTNFDKQLENFGIEIATLNRLGDEKPLVLAVNFLKSRYELLTENQVEDLGLFLKNNPNPRALPVKYLHNLWDFGHESEVYKGKTVVKHEPQKLTEKTISGTKLGNVIPPEKLTLENLVVSPTIQESIQLGLAKIKHQEFLVEKWNLKSLGESVNRNVLNFYGPPGTGKTLSAKVISSVLSKPILQVDYAQVESKWAGETGKNIQTIFNQAQELGAILLLDEADSLVSRRQGASSYQASFLNETRNIFMQELDKFKGIVILTTNFFSNYDEALLRRVSQHVQFELPTCEQREKIFKQNIPSEVKVQDLDFAQLANLSSGFSGGDIKVLCVEAMVQAVVSSVIPESAILTMQELTKEISKIKLAKNTFSGVKSPLGINS